MQLSELIQNKTQADAALRDFYFKHYTSAMQKVFGYKPSQRLMDVKITTDNVTFIARDRCSCAYDCWPDEEHVVYFDCLDCPDRLITMLTEAKLRRKYIEYHIAKCSECPNIDFGDPICEEDFCKELQYILKHKLWDVLKGENNE